MKYQFFIITKETNNDDTMILGLAYNLKHTIQWAYWLKDETVEIVDSLANTLFYQELEHYLKTKDLDALTFTVKEKDENMKTAANIMTSVDEMRRYYRGKK